MNGAHPNPALLRAVDENVVPEELAGEVYRHLESCEICSRLKQDLSSVALSEPALAEVARLRRRIFGRKRRWGLPWMLAAGSTAAAMIVGVWLWQPGQRSTPEPPQALSHDSYRLTVPAAPLRLPLASALLLRGQQDKASETYLQELGVALEPYRAGRFADAVAKLEALKARYSSAVEPPFYLGVSKLLAGDAPAAIAPLERARQIGGEALNDDILWYLAAAFERTGSWQRSMPLLRKVCEGESEYRKAACDALAR